MKRLIAERLRTLAKRPWLWHYTTELMMFAGAGTGAFLLRFEFSIPPLYIPHLLIALPIWAVVKLAVFHVQGLDRLSWRFVSVSDAIRLAIANGLGSLLSALLILAVAPQGFPRSIPIIDFLLCSACSAAAFLGRRAIVEASAEAKARSGRSVVIYGAGRAGVTLLSELRVNSALPYSVRGFIDDDPAMSGVYVQGTPVLGRGVDLAGVVERKAIEEVLIAIPSATGEQMSRILGHCEKAGVRFRTVSALGEVIEGRALVSQIREVDLHDLLCRHPVRLDHQQIRNKIEDRVVMITGAGGSIGSELCRQVARFKPAAIVAFEIGETALFHLEREIRTKFPDALFHPEIGSVQSPRRLAAVLRLHKPTIIYHAAAYKHVPMMESNLFEALENNVFGTYNVATAAEQHGVEDFVLISSDKAVRPVSVMGATKRLDELIILAMQDHPVRFVAVRFGNVLGSNGSVIPSFKEQIAAGGPVTVTHPGMRRYFMTIPEAAQLVLQASSMGKGGEIFVLDMGKPLKIVDLARNLILLSGLRPGIDIKIEFTGTRPGEKLFEELSFFGEKMIPTDHEKIKVFAGNGLPHGDMVNYLGKLRMLCESRDIRGVVFLLKEIVPEYNPSNHVLRQLLLTQESVQESDNVQREPNRRYAVG